MANALALCQFASPNRRAISLPSRSSKIVAGNPRTPISRAKACRGSRWDGRLSILIFLKNAAILSGGLGPVAIVTTAKLLPPNVDCRAESSGISLRHGAHHVAQKLSMTTLP